MEINLTCSPLPYTVSGVLVTAQSAVPSSVLKKHFPIALMLWVNLSTGNSLPNLINLIDVAFITSFIFLWKSYDIAVLCHAFQDGIHSIHCGNSRYIILIFKPKLTSSFVILPIYISSTVIILVLEIRRRGILFYVKHNSRWYVFSLCLSVYSFLPSVLGPLGPRSPLA